MTTTAIQPRRVRRSSAGRHHQRNSNTIAAQQSINDHVENWSRNGRHRAASLTAHSPVKPAVAALAASVIALAPLHATGTLPHHAGHPTIVAPNVQLTTVVSQRDIDALVGNLKSSLAGASTTVTALVGLPGQTLQSALTTAVALNDSLWNGLTTATANPVLDDVLKALHTVSSGGLTQLAASVEDAGGTLVLTSEQITELLTSTLTGSLSTALTAVAGVVNDPLNAAKYIALLNSPLSIAGRILNQGITATADLATNGIALGGTFVTAVTAQVTNALDGVNKLIGAAEAIAPGNDLIAGVLTAVQGIVSAPVRVAIAGVNGLTTTVTDAADVVVSRLAGGAQSVVATWLGDGSTGGAVQDIITTIGSAPLSPASYTAALATLVGAGIKTVTTMAHTAGSFASLPFSIGSNLTGTVASMLTSFVTDAATATSGILRAAGLSPLVYGLPKVLAAGVNTAINVAATAVKLGLNTIAGALDLGSTIGGALTPKAVTETALASAASTRQSMVTLSATTADADEVSTDDGESGNTAAPDQTVKKRPAAVNTPVTTETDGESSKTSTQDELDSVTSQPTATPAETDTPSATGGVRTTHAPPAHADTTSATEVASPTPDQNADAAAPSQHSDTRTTAASDTNTSANGDSSHDTKASTGKRRAGTESDSSTTTSKKSDSTRRDGDATGGRTTQAASGRGRAHTTQGGSTPHADSASETSSAGAATAPAHRR
jgi:hypothetical protein